MNAFGSTQLAVFIDAQRESERVYVQPSEVCGLATYDRGTDHEAVTIILKSGQGFMVKGSAEYVLEELSNA